MHRLDVQTSGILMCAKTYVGAYWLRLQWCSYAVDKEYVCLVHGWVDRGVREIHKRIRVDKKKAPNSRRTISTHCSISDSGKPSFTELVTLAHLEAAAPLGVEQDASDTPRESDGGADAVSEPDRNAGKYSLVALKLHTGRTHQIRVHMLSIGHPLVCDAKYAEDRLAVDRKWCPRNFLHTYRMAFDDVPDSVERGTPDGSETVAQEPVEVYCPLPRDLRDVLGKLSPADDASNDTYHAWLTGDAGQLKRFDDIADEADSSASPADS